MPRIRTLVLALCCLPLTSCVVLEQPLSDPHEARPDPFLIGPWLQRQEGATHLVVIGRYPFGPDKQPSQVVPAGIMSYQVASLNSDGTLSLEQGTPLLFFTSHVGMDNYMNIFDSKAVQVEDGKWQLRPGTEFLTFKYQINKDKLELWGLDTTKVKAAVDKGILKGETKKGLISKVVLRDPASVRTFLVKEGQTLLSEKPFGMLTRIANHVINP